ncbi:SDR family oxidoreductase [Fictibacillus sp. WQ 8-8]|uniref:SDR family NAD(P)-dependent oxidoreductase n=1 Tax=Fictibacillus sp. WQ 8-8 TaxID=2938788 RepID=UPI00210E9718|nr:SDR family oxidoreductase [Fictibacillus sp. WQ 8-8]MCQ6268368.1 SDR family oxidoreductase [Fictibacillus sp. WQ 8-8]
MNFVRKRVIITGAAGLIGTWIAKAFAEKEACLWLLDIRKEELDELIKEDSFGRASEVRIEQIDLLDYEAIQSFAKKVEEAWGAPDIVINNAGVYPSQMLLDVTQEEWEKVLGLNLHAPFTLTKELAKQMILENVQGSIVNIISRSAFVPRLGSGSYAVSKAGLHMLTRSFALELAPHKIRVNSLSPGLTPGSQVNSLSENYIEAMLKNIPLGRTAGPNDAPQAILFLCSEHASFITGATLTVDGGNSAGIFNLPLSNE